MQKEIENDNQQILIDLKKKIKSIKDITLKKKSAHLYNIFKKILKIETVHQSQKLQLRDIYNEKTTQITSESDNLIEGKTAIPEPLIKNWLKTHDPDFQYTQKDLKNQKVKNFWLNFILNNEIYNGIDDEEILHNLEKIEIINKTDSKDEFLKMTDFICYFSENKYFDNKMLKTTLFYEGEQIMASKGTLINWKINPTLKKVKKIQVNKRTKKKRSVFKNVQKRSFFEIFGNFQLDDDFVGGNLDEDAPVMNLLVLDECVKIFVDSLPYALEYYLDLGKGFEEMESIKEVVEVEGN